MVCPLTKDCATCKKFIEGKCSISESLNESNCGQYECKMQILHE
jgi:hypothetical protein